MSFDLFPQDLRVVWRVRQAADLALTLALAGCHEPELFKDLAATATRELHRQRSLLSVQQTTERLATAGYRQRDCPELFQAALEALERLSCPWSSNLRDLRAGNYSLHSARPLEWLYRHTTRHHRGPPPQGPVRLQRTAQPVALDLGCGFGAGALGLAQHLDVVAVDVSAHCCGYARALAQRWGVKLQVVQAEALQVG